MADQRIVTSIVANADFSNLIADVQKVTSSLSKLQQQLATSNKMLVSQIAAMNRSFADTLNASGQFSKHFVTLTSDVDKFGKNLDSGKLKLSQYFNAYQQHAKTTGGIIRDLAKQQVQMQNSVLQPLGKNAQGLQQFYVNVPRGLDAVKNKTAIARQELQILNKVIQDGANQLVNWGKNTQWAGRQLTVGLTVPLSAFGKAAADAFRQADEQLVRLTKVYGGLAAVSTTELKKVRQDVSATAKEIAKSMGASYKDTIALAADIAATGKTGKDLIGSVKETSRLAVLGEVDRQSAMKATLAIQTAFKQNTDQLSESINFLNAVENQTSTTLQDLVDAIPKAGPIIKGLGGNIKDLALYMTAMKEGGISAAEAANALKSGMASLINPTKVATDLFTSFGIDLKGIVSRDAGNLTQTLLDLQAALDQLNPLQKQQALEQLFGKFQFARMNALFANLGRQGSQTLQVLDLMKASSQDLAKIAGRELAQVTESASGKYKRALEGLRADLSGVGEQFLNLETHLINIVDKVIQFANHLPKPLKQVLAVLGGLTAVAGPLIMLTGVLANFFGYVLKGAMHMKALFKGGEGWKLLTPEILAAQRAGSLVEKTFYSDSKAASVLQMALKNLIDEFSVLEQRANAGAVAVSSAFQTAAGNPIIGGPRIVDPRNPLVGAPYSRASTHMVPRSTLTEQQKLSQTIFGLVPGSEAVNRRIGNNPQIYMNEPLPNVPGLTTINNVSTGVVSSEAAKWYSMMAALGMQSKQEVAGLKKEIATTGLVSKEFMATFEEILPAVSALTNNAAVESSAIVADLRAGKLNVNEAKAKIIALNLQVEQDIAAAAGVVATSMGKTINPTIVPTLNQPVVDASGKSNMRELFKKSKTKQFVDKIAGALGVRTSGAGYNIHTTIPKKFAMGDIVPGSGNQDTVDARLTPGEFVVRKDAVNSDTLPFLRALNNGEKSFMPAIMMHQGISANQALAGNRPGIDLTGSFIANDWQSLHARGLHPMALLYDQGLRLGYNKAELQTILGTAYNEITGTFSAMGNKKVTNSDFERISSRVLMKHLRGISRFSSNLQKRVSLADELILIGHQRNEAGKAMLPGSARSFGFDGTSLPRYLIGTGSGFSGSQNTSHFNLAQELYSTAPSNLYTGSVGGGENTLSKIFGSQKGHVTPTISPSNYNNLIARIKYAANAVLNKPFRLPRNPYTPNAAFPGKKFQGLHDGGLVAPEMWTFGRTNVAGTASPRVSPITRLQMGGWWPGQASSKLNYNQYGELQPGKTPSRFGTSQAASMVGSMAGATVGGAMGGNFGSIIGMMAGSALPSLIGKVITAIKTFGSLGQVIGKAAMILKSFTLPGLVVTAILAVGQSLWVWKRHLEDIGKAHRAIYGPTKKSLEEVGLQYTSVNDKIKQVNDNLKLQKEKLLANYASSTSSGIKGLTLTIQQLNDGIKSAKKNAKETVQDFNKLTGKNEVVKLAASLKQQYISAGMSVQEATNTIYTLIKASDKGAYALDAITSKAFTGITDKATAADYIVNLLAKSLKNTGQAAEQTATGIANMLNSLDAYQQALIGIKDANGKIITQQEAMQKALERIVKIKGTEKALNMDTLNALKSQNLELASVLGKSETLASVYAKLQLLQGGFGDVINLSGLSSDQAVQAAKGMQIVEDAATKGIKNTDGLGKAYDALNDSIKANNAIVSAAPKRDYQAEINAIDKIIKKIEQERDARLKALDAQQSAADFNIQLQKEQLAYQQALLTGDMAGAAQSQLNIQQLTQQHQVATAKEAITAQAQAKIDAQNAKKEAVQNASNAQQTTITNAGNAAANAAGQKSAIDAFVSALNPSISRISQTRIITDPDIQLAREAVKTLSESGAVGKAQAAKYTKLYNLNNTDAGYIKLIQSMLGNTDNSLSSSVGTFADAVEAFRLAIETQTGKKIPKPIPSGSAPKAGSYNAPIRTFHTWNGIVPGKYGMEVPAVLKAGTEGVYQNSYINSLRNDSSTSKVVINSLEMKFDGVPSDPRKFGADLAAGLSNPTSLMDVKSGRGRLISSR